MASPSPAAVQGGAPEVEVARDLARRALPVAAVLIGVSAIGWQLHGALTAAFAVTVVVVNFLAAALLMAWAARISLAVLMGTVLGGFVVRMGVIALAVVAVRNQSWVSLPVLAFTLVVAHLTLLFWELRHLSISLAFPGLKPALNKETRAA
jgi:hypothetical protein